VGLDSGTAQTQTTSLVKEGERKLPHQERGASSPCLIEYLLLAYLRNHILATTTTTKTSITLDL
jgi:hypothetical protein